MSARSGPWTRELLELAALFLAVAAAEQFAGSVAHLSGAAVVLTAMAVFLVLGAAGHHRLRHRSRGPQPAPHPAPVPVPADEVAAPATWRTAPTSPGRPARYR